MRMELTFRIIAFGIQPQFDSQRIRNQLPKLFMGDPTGVSTIIDRILTNQQVILAKNVPRENAEHLRQILTEMGLKCRMEPMQLTLAPIDDEISLYKCPACGYKQPISSRDICKRCGVVSRNYQDYCQLKEAQELERQRSRTVQLKKTWKLLPILTNIGIAAGIGVAIGLAFWSIEIDRPPQTTTQPESSVRSAINASLENATKLEPIAPQPAKTSANQTSASSSASLPSTPPFADPKPPVIPPPPIATPQPQPVSPPVFGSTDSATPFSGRASTPSTASQNKKALPNPTLESIYNRDNTLSSNSTDHSEQTDGSTSPAPDKSTAVTTPPTNTPPPARASNPRLLIGLARYQAEKGDLAAAQDTFKQLNGLSDSYVSNLPAEQVDAFTSTRVETMAVLANQEYKQKAFSVAQELWLQAINLTNNIKFSNERAVALASLARSLHSSNTATARTYFKRAEENARVIEDSALRATTLSVLARDLAATGRSDQSRELFAQAKTLVAELPNPTIRLIALSVVAQHLAEAGDTTTANSLLEQIDTIKIEAPPLAVIQHRLQAQGAIARDLARKGDPSAKTQLMATLRSAETVAQPATRDAVLLYLAKTLVHAGDPKSADQIVAELLKKHGISTTTAKAQL